MKNYLKENSSLVLKMYELARSHRSFSTLHRSGETDIFMLLVAEITFLITSIKSNLKTIAFDLSVTFTVCIFVIIK